MSRDVSALGGPKPVPLLGNLPELIRGRVPGRVMERWADEYGLSFRLRMGPTEVVGTADPDIVDTVLRKRPDDFRRGAMLAGVFDEIAPSGLFTAEGDRWHRLRKLATRSLNAAYLREYFSTIARVTERLLRQWETAASTGEPIDVLDRMKRFTLDVTAGLSMGHDLNSLEATGDGLHNRIATLFPAIDRRLASPFPYWRYLKLRPDRRLDATLREIEALIQERFQAARVRVSDGEPPANFLEALVQPIDDEPGITDAEVFGNVLTMLVAGEDTTSATAAWALHHLAENPDIQQQVRAEADEVIGDQRLPGDPATIGRLRYAEAVVNEVLRMQPVTPVMPVQPTRDLTVGDLSLPAGQMMYVLMSYGARRDTARFPDPDVFRPERWLEGNLPKEALPFAPFGGGPRFCPGRNLAVIETTMITSVLARAFDLEPDRSRGPVIERTAFSAYPANLYLVAHSRPSRAVR